MYAMHSKIINESETLRSPATSNFLPFFITTDWFRCDGASRVCMGGWKSFSLPKIWDDRQEGLESQSKTKHERGRKGTLFILRCFEEKKTKSRNSSFRESIRRREREIEVENLLRHQKKKRNGHPWMLHLESTFRPLRHASPPYFVLTAGSGREGEPTMCEQGETVTKRNYDKQEY